ncbi:Phosphotransferase enzyme family protein [Lentibacillus halodurans]|uniref:Phosphotransferase enzyme family protein n=2 Tax=Lentibacillus halodurans TaxID=237679 RepID=A0A1I0XZK2_9BACI|nr:Phosphotransferase enzyme family protein [Lentibacillus halodurans]
MNMYGTSLPDYVLRWIIHSVDPSVQVESVYKLKGSTSSLLHGIALRVGDSVKHYVLRQFDNRDWLVKEPDLAVHEAASLQMADSVKVAVLEVIANDALGDHCGVPAVLMTKLEGTVELKPDDQDRWLDGLAGALADIHSLDADGFPYEYFPYNDADSFDVPYWSGVPGLWEKVLDLVKGSRPDAHECFIHRDYHPANVLWKNGNVSGVVDWVNACKGPREVDIGHCRLNLAMLYGPEWANRFLLAYKRYAGKRFTYDPYWDVIALIDFLDGPPEVYPGWEAFGVTGLTDSLIKKRLDAFIQV